MIETIRNTISKFCVGFVHDPYLCYTEHGQHALFYCMLLAELPEQNRYAVWKNQKVCVLQKEYPTAGPLGKPQRQHWDIAVLKTPLESIRATTSFDFLKLLAVVEFGLNEAKTHLEDDLSRLCHKQANLENGFIVHLYRLSESGALFSGRDWSPASPRIVSLEKIRLLSAGTPIEIFYGMSDSTGTHETGVWHVKDGLANPIVSKLQP